MRNLILLDIEDEHLRDKYNWQLDSKGYVCYYNHWQKLRLHRMVMKVHGQSVQIDHINRNKLDNRKSNLRICSNSENCQNQTERQNNSSGYKGVSFDKKSAMWRTCISAHGKYIQVYSCVDSKEECAYAYNYAAQQLHKEFAYLNPITLAESDAKRVQDFVDKRIKLKLKC